MTESNRCEKSCVPECIFGKCVNGQCICDSGFQLYDGICIQTTSTTSTTTSTTSTTTSATTKAVVVDVTTEYFEIDDVTTENVPCNTCESEDCDDDGKNECLPFCGRNKEICVNGTCISPGVCECFDGFGLLPNSLFVCVLEEIATVQSAPVRAHLTNYVSLIVVLLIVSLMTITLILLLYRRNCKVNYNVDEKGKKTKEKSAKLFE